MVSKQKGFNDAFTESWYFIVFHNNLYLLPLVSLMFINWILEAVKWQQLLKPLQKIDLYKSLKSVVSGVSLSFITVGGVGDYFGRSMFVDKKNLKSLIGVTVAGGVYQNLVTYFAGGIGIILYIEYQFKEVFYGLWLLLFVLFLLVFYLVLRVHLVSKIKFLKPFTYALSAYTLNEKLFIFSLSFSRYVIILVQYYLILQALQVQIGYTDFFTGIALMLLLKSSIPRFSFLSDLGIREFSALLFFTKIGLEPAVIISSTLMLWVINVLTPAIIGIFFILNRK